MYKRLFLFLSIVALFVLVAGCGAKATPEPVVTPALEVTPATETTPETNASFDAPVPNQVEMHEHSSEAGEHEHVHLDASQATMEMEVALVSSELVVGHNRFAVGLFDAQGGVVHDAEVHFHYFDLRDPAAPVLESHGEATPLQTPDGQTTVFAQERDFADAGKWGVEVQARFVDGTAAIKRIGFTVLADSPTLKPGATAPEVDTPTAADVNGDLSLLTSAPTPNPAFYTQSLTEAVANDKPTALLIATPAFCQTRFCGPAYELTSALQEKYGEQVNFVHVEVYTGLPNPSSNNWEVAPAMTAFGLTTEPWFYLLDRNGVVFYRVEGLFTLDEVAAPLQTLLDAAS